MTSTDGIYVDATQIAAGDMAGASSARKVLRNPAIDYAVLETARGGILRSGLGFDRCDVAVVTNVSSDHLGLGGVATLEELAQVKAVVPRAVHRDGASVLNADNSYTVEMAEVAGGEIIFFSMDACNPVVRDHLRAGGRAVVLRLTDAGEMLTLLAGQEAPEILLAEEIPATMEGRIRVNIQNAMAAAAAALAQDVPPETIRSALRGFSSSFAQTPGRFNLLEIDGRKVLIDYVHNLHGMEAMADFVKRLDVDRAVAVIRMPGDRRDEDIEAFGRLAAETFEELVIREGKVRGRKPGEVPDLLRAAALAGGLAPDKVSIVLDERRAVARAIERGDPGDLVVLMADEGRVSWLWKQVARGAVIDVAG
jgi:cyanophycin synthetase